MLEQHTKDMILVCLRENMFNISEACSELGITLEQFNSCRSDEKFQDGLVEARQICDDYARSQFMSLIKTGHAGSIIEYQKMLRQSDDQNAALAIRKKCMKFFIQNADTKALVLRTFSDCFGESAKGAEKFYEIAMTEFGLLSPAQRKKEETKNQHNKMSALLERGELSEFEMIKGLLVKALDDAENAEYPSERAKATEQSIKLTQRKDELEEKKRRSQEEDDTPLHLKVDAVMFGSSPEHVERVNEMRKAAEVKKIEG